MTQSLFPIFFCLNPISQPAFPLLCSLGLLEELENIIERQGLANRDLGECQLNDERIPIDRRLQFECRFRR